ncbi:MAG TPA: hypothetical protein VIW21_03900 [Chthoniobacterales bacterium]|jgi:antitoxin component YwqK of YwqJK toxin-antitoxin module
MQRLLRSIIAFALLLALPLGFGQTNDQNESGAVRVRVAINPDGSRTLYKFDDAQHTATATTTDEDGKLREKIDYKLDDNGRFSSASIFGAGGKLKFKSRYRYDDAGRLKEELQLDENDAVLHKIVYSYNEAGKETGYSVFDANGKLLNRVTPAAAYPILSATPRKKR